MSGLDADATLPDLVHDSKLTAHYHEGETIHMYQECDPTSGNRLVPRAEHWQRQKKIGTGAYGSVWLEKCTKGRKDGVRVRAVKQSHIDGQSSSIDYHRELEVIAKFSNSKYARCFVKSFGWYESAGSICIAMEYLDNVDLQTYLKHSTLPLAEGEAKEITFQVLEGLMMMHQNNLPIVISNLT